MPLLAQAFWVRVGGCRDRLNTGSLNRKADPLKNDDGPSWRLGGLMVRGFGNQAAGFDVVVGFLDGFRAGVLSCISLAKYFGLGLGAHWV